MFFVECSIYVFTCIEHTHTHTHTHTHINTHINTHTHRHDMRRRLREHSALLRAPRADSTKISRSQRAFLVVMLKRPMASAFQAWKASHVEQLQEVVDAGNSRGRPQTNTANRHAQRLNPKP